MGEKFSTLTVNGMDVEVWHNADASGRQEARSLAGRLPRGGELGDGSIRRIDAPAFAGGTVDVWLAGDGFSRFDVPDGYEVTSVCGFETPGTCITMQRE